ncbi:response regulator [Sulfurimonas sp.]
MGLFSLFFKEKKHLATSSNVLDEIADKEFYKNLVDNEKSMILYFHEKSGWIGANKTFFTTTNLNDINDFIRVYESIRDMFIHESENVFTESDKGWLEYIIRHKPQGYKVRMLNAADELLILNAKCKILKEKSLYILELEDITVLEKERVKTKEIEKLKTKFLANIGHEFRTPMNAILGFMELLENTKLNNTQQEYLKMIAYSSKNLMTNIETLLELSQLQSGRLKVFEDDFNLVDELEKLIYSFYKEAKIKEVKVLTFIDPKLPKYIKSDGVKIIQIMYSIIHHSIKLTKAGSRISIEVKLSKIATDGSCSVGFAIKDDGEGISKEQQALINEPFTASTHSSERLGVGLSLSNGLIQLLGSELRIHSEQDSGTYMHFLLDFKESYGRAYNMLEKKKVKVLLLNQRRIDEANSLSTYLTAFGLDVIKSNSIDKSIYDGIEALYIVANQNNLSWVLELASYDKRVPIIMLLENDELLSSKLNTLVNEVINLPLFPSKLAKHLDLLESYDYDIQEIEPKKMKAKIKALVVEDNIINLRLIQILLEEYGIKVSTALNGLEAVDRCKSNFFDIVFMDIDMPYMNGIVATKEIKEDTSLGLYTPIVALTAMAMQGDREMLLSEGLDDYLAKPLTRDKLEYILEKYLKVEEISASV